jgi:hypothetical protein
MLGYLENWGPSIKWWDEQMPGKCTVGCYKPDVLIADIEPYHNLNYIGTWITTSPNSDQIDCPNATSCPKWNNQAIYLADYPGVAGEGAIACNDATSVSNVSPGMIAISEAVRMARQHPSGPKRLKVTLGGWSDYARIDNAASGKKLGKLFAKLIKWTFADGGDLDLEHLTPFAEFGDEFAGYIALANTLREEFDNDITPNWAANANARAAALQREYDGLLPYQQTGALGSFYRSQIHYMGEVAANPAPHLELTWTTRFNAFLPDDDDYNYITKDSVRPNCSFVTDREGAKLWAQTSNAFDTVNIMGYDAAQFCDDGAGGLVPELFDLDFEKILQNFHEIGNIPKSKLMMGFGVGDQDAGAKWEGMDKDVEVFKYLKKEQYGGGFIWAVNCNPDVTPNCPIEAPKAARLMNQELQPVWPWGKVPTYSKCNPSTGWGPFSSTEAFV